MSNEFQRGFWCGFLPCLAIGIVASGFTAGCIEYFTTRHIQREAIEHSAAEYVFDPATGAVEFRWKEADHAR